MKILKSEQYISEKLNIQPVSKDRLVELCKEPEFDDKTKQFIEDGNLIWNTSTRCYDCDGDVEITNDIVSDGKLKIRFGKVNGDFVCINRLTTLEGAPQEIGGDFYCINNKLTTLEGAPQKVSGDFVCSGNHLTTLEGAPQEVGGDFICSSNNLTTLEGAPNEVGGNFYCRNNQNLVLPKNKPSWIKGNIIQ